MNDEKFLKSTYPCDYDYFEVVGPGTHHKRDGLLAVEAPLLLRVKDIGDYRLLCTPIDLEALIVGFLFAENMITTIHDVKMIDFAEPIVTVTLQIPTGVKSCKHRSLIGSEVNPTSSSQEHLFSHITPNQMLFKKIDARKICAIMDELQRRQKFYPPTRSTHAAALFNEAGEILFFAEDVARHNVLDKVIGMGLLQEQPVCGTGAALSSRISFEMASKAARAGIEVISALPAPTSLAIAAARYWNMTLCGFAKDNHVNIYTHLERN